MPHKEEKKIVTENSRNLSESPTAGEQDISESPIEDLSPEIEQEQSPTPEAEIQHLKLQLDEYKDLFLRKAAEFENYKRRRQGEYSALTASATEAVISELLPVLDDLDRLLASAPPEADKQEAAQSLWRGARLIRDKLMDLLSARGVEPISAVGALFDPELHEALLQQQDAGSEPGLVLQEYLRGYRLQGRVIRHAQVVVSG